MATTKRTPAPTPAKARKATAKVPKSKRSLMSVSKQASGAWAAFLDNGGVDPAAVARDLGLTKADLADTLGLPADALLREERIMADKTQARLSELMQILRRVEPWAGGLRPAFAWYRSFGIAPLGDETAEALVRTNRAGHVRTYLNAIAAGAHA